MGDGRHGCQAWLTAASATAAASALLLATLALPSAAQAAEEFGIKGFEAGTCVTAACTYKSVEEHPEEAYVVASGHPPYGITGFEVTTTPVLLGEKPVEPAKRARVDVPPGLAANPTTVPQCPVEKFNKNECPESTQVGEVKIKAAVGGLTDTEVGGTVYSLVQEPGLPLEFGIHVSVAGVINENILLHGHLSDHREPELEAVGLRTGDYHEWFELNNLPHETAEPIRSTVIFFGNRVGSGFLTMPSECGKTAISHLQLESYGGKVVNAFTHTPIGVSFCGQDPFAPLSEAIAGPANSESGPGPGEPDGAAVALKLPQNATANETDSADVHHVEIQLPEGLTINPSSANGLVACTEKQFGVAPDPQGTIPITEPGNGVGGSAPISCPPASQIGTFVIETPDLPPGSLRGPAFVGAPLSEDPTSGDRYRVFLSAESARYGVTVRLIARVAANPQTGRLTAYVEVPQLPFGEATLRLEPKAKSVLANPLTCNQAPTESTFVPYGEGTPPAIKPPVASAKRPFAPTGCQSPPPFSPGQQTVVEPSQAGASSTFTFHLERSDAEPNPTQLTVHLPEGLLAHLGAPAQCSEAQALSLSCPPQSQIGTVSTEVGAGGQPLTIPVPGEEPGAVYLTGPIDGAPYGLAFVLPAEHVGPYNFGKIVTLASLSVNPETTQVTVTTVPQGNPGALPTIVGGVPIRLRQIEVTVNRPEFMVNPTSCSPLSTNTVAAGVLALPPTEQLSAATSSPLAISGCQNLPFAPKISASSSAHTSRLEGAELSLTVAPQSGNANIKEMTVVLPPQLPSRLSTLNQACTEQVFNANPANCDAGSRVGTVTVSTPLLPEPLKGTAYLVARGDEFPDLVFLLSGDRINLTLDGHTRIHDGITSSTFPSLPDAPFTTFTADFPMGRNSLLSANGSLCFQTTYRTVVRVVRRRVKVRSHGRVVRRLVSRRKRVRLATRSPLALKLDVVAVAQNGRKLEEEVPISVAGCGATVHRSANRLQGFRLLGMGLHRGILRVRLYAPKPGRLTVKLLPGGIGRHSVSSGSQLIRLRVNRALVARKGIVRVVIRYLPRGGGRAVVRRALIRRGAGGA